MTPHPDEQAREIVDYFGGSSKANSIEFVGRVLARVRLQEWIAAPVHAWPDDGTTYPQKFGAELVKYRNKRIIELEASLRAAAAQPGDTADRGER